MTLTNELLRITQPLHQDPHQDPHQRVVTYPSTTTPGPSPTSCYVSLNHYTMTLTNELLRITQPLSPQPLHQDPHQRVVTHPSTTTPGPSPTSCYASPQPLHHDPHQRVVTYLLNHYTKTLTNELLRIPQPLHHDPHQRVVTYPSTTTPGPSPTSCYASPVKMLSLVDENENIVILFD